MQLSFESVDLVLVARAAVEAARPTARSKGVELVDRMTDRLFVSGDAARLQQVVANLISNAVKFTPSSGHVTLSACRVGRWCQLVVADDGPGIDPAMLPAVFEPFRRGRDTAQGLGLGLNIARSIVHLHKGRIHAESAGRGRGSKFVVELPGGVGERVGSDAPRAGQAGDQR